MTVLTTIPNGASNKDIRDTWNAALADIRTLKAGGGTPTPSPTPTPTPTPTPGAFTMGQIAESRHWQRSTTSGGTAGLGTGSVIVPMTVTQAGPVYVRQRRADNTIAAAAYLAIANQGVTSGEQMVALPGVSAVADLFYVDTSPNGTGNWQLGMKLQGMTDLDNIVGQSLAVNDIINGHDSATISSLGVTIDQRTRARCTLTDLPDTHSAATVLWEAPSDAGRYRSAFIAEAGRLIGAAQGMPAGFIGHAQGNQGLDSFYGSGSNAAAFAAAMDKAGGFARLRINHAHSDAAGGVTFSQRQARLSALRAFAAQHNAARGDDFITLVEGYPNVYLDSYGTPAQRNTIRRADMAWCADPANKAIYLGTVDQELADGVHQTQAGAVTFARAYYRAIRPLLGLSHDHVGSAFLSATRAGKVITLVTTFRNGATALAALGNNTAGRFKAFLKDDFTSPLGLDGTTPYAILSNGNVTLNLAADPGNSAALDFYFAPPWYDNVGGIYDNATDGDGIARGRHVQANPVPLPIAAPGAGSGGGSTKLGPDLTNVNMTFGDASGSGYGKERASGYASTPDGTAIFGAVPWTMQVRFRADPTAAGVLGCLMGAAAPDGSLGWLAIRGDQDGYVQVNFSGGYDLNLAGNVIDDQYHTVTVECDVDGKVTGYVDGAPKGSRPSGGVSTGGTFVIGRYDSGYDFRGHIDEFAVWAGIKYGGAHSPVSPIAGTEAGLRSLYKFEGDTKAFVKS